MSTLDLAIGTILIGTMLNVLLYGTMIMQTYVYFQRFQTDGIRIRSLVIFLALADTANTIFGIVVIYQFTITHFGDFVAISHGSWRAGMGPILTAIIGGVVQSFFTWRVQHLNKSVFLSISLYILIIVQSLGGIATGIVGTIYSSFVDWTKPEVKLPIIVWLVSAAVVDCMITAAITLPLRKSRTGFAVTDDLITKIVRMTLQTGLLTATWAVTDVVLYLASDSNIHMIFNLALPKLYTNSLLSTLNARISMSGSSAHSGKIHTDGGWKDPADRTGIHVTTTATVHRDDFELSETKKSPVADDGDTTSGSADLDIEANKDGQYALKWSDLR